MRTNVVEGNDEIAETDRNSISKVLDVAVLSPVSAKIPAECTQKV